MSEATVCRSVCVVAVDGFWCSGEAALDVLIVAGDCVSDSLCGC